MSEFEAKKLSVDESDTETTKNKDLELTDWERIDNLEKEASRRRKNAAAV